MRLLSFLSKFREGEDLLERIRASKLGIVFVCNGVYNIAITENGKKSTLLDRKDVSLYALIPDIETRGFKLENIDARVKPVSYEDLVDLIFNEYDKVIWL